MEILLGVSGWSVKSIIPNQTTVNESQSVIFTINTSGLMNGSIIYWRLAGVGVNSSDFTSGVSGSAVVNNNKATITVNLREDQLTEGIEYFYITIHPTAASQLEMARSGLITITDSSLTRSVSITSSASTINEGQAVTFTVQFTNFPTGTVLSYNISGGVNSADFTDNKVIDNITIPSSGSVSITKTTLLDTILENDEIINFRIMSSSNGSGSVLASRSVTIKNVNNAGYTAFLTKLNTAGAVKSTSTIGSASGTFLIDLSSSSLGTMWGTPHGNYFTTDSSLSRIIRHALPDLTTANENFNSSRRVRVVYAYFGSRGSYVSLNRNNYTSSSYGTFNGGYLTEIVYWDNVLGKGRKRNPINMSSPTDF